MVTWAADTETEECDRIAETIQRLHTAGLPYRDIAVLVRSRAAYPELLGAFDPHQVPVQPAGRTGLFAGRKPGCSARPMRGWLITTGRQSSTAGGQVPEEDEVVAEYASLYQLDRSRTRAVRDRLTDMEDRSA